MLGHEGEPDFREFEYESSLATNQLRQRFRELSQQGEESMDAYRRVFEEFKAELSLGSADWHEYSAAIRCLASGRNQLADYLMALGYQDDAIEELHIALKDLERIQGIDAFQQRGSTHGRLGDHFWWRSRKSTGDSPNPSDLAAAFKHHSLSLSYGGMGLQSITIRQLQQMVDILEANPDSSPGTIGLCDILINITPEDLTYRYRRAERMAAIGMRDVLAREAELEGDASFEDIARAVAASAALEDHDQARTLTTQGRKKAKASGDEAWLKAFASYRRKRRHPL